MGKPHAAENDPAPPSGAESDDTAPEAPQPSAEAMSETLRHEVIRLNQHIEQITANRLWLVAVLYDLEAKNRELAAALASLDATPQE